MFKEHAHYPGEVWARLELPYRHCHGEKTYALEVSMWHGLKAATAKKLNLVSASTNNGLALAFNWPRAPRDEGRTVVSRPLGMSLLFDEELWGMDGYARFDSRLVVHHVDTNHPNNFINNLWVEVGGDHVGWHDIRR